MARAIGAGELLIEIHPNPEKALSDGAQSLDFDAFARLLSALRQPAEPLGRVMN